MHPPAIQAEKRESAAAKRPAPVLITSSSAREDLPVPAKPHHAPPLAQRHVSVERIRTANPARPEIPAACEKGGGLPIYAPRGQAAPFVISCRRSVGPWRFAPIVRTASRANARSQTPRGPRPAGFQFVPNLRSPAVVMGAVSAPSWRFCVPVRCQEERGARQQNALCLSSSRPVPRERIASVRPPFEQRRISAERIRRTREGNNGNQRERPSYGRRKERSAAQSAPRQPFVQSRVSAERPARRATPTPNSPPPRKGRGSLAAVPARRISAE